MNAADDSRATDASPGRWEKPFGQGMAGTLPLGVWLAVAFLGFGPHSGPGAAVVPLIGLAMFVLGLLAFSLFAWRRQTRALAGGIGTGLLVFLGLYFTLGMISLAGCGFFC
jgi:hypothetical protein